MKYSKFKIQNQRQNNSHLCVPLMADLLLHILLHLMTYDAAQTVRPLKSYNRKNSNNGTVPYIFYLVESS
jgi:hypothetical protein